jgi:hypothetical protein
MNTVTEVVDLRRATPIAIAMVTVTAAPVTREENLLNVPILPDHATATKMTAMMKLLDEKSEKQDGHAERLLKKRRGSLRSKKNRKSNRSNKNGNRGKSRRKNHVVVGIRERKSIIIALITTGVDNLRLLPLRGRRN